MIRFKRIHNDPLLDSTMPTRQTSAAAGFDLYSTMTAWLAPGETSIIGTGWSVQLPAGTVGLIRDRSSVAKRQIIVTGGVIDSDYRGEIKVMLANLASDWQRIDAGHRIAQLLAVPIITADAMEVDALEPSTRGANGFGSTGQ